MGRPAASEDDAEECWLGHKVLGNLINQSAEAAIHKETDDTNGAHAAARYEWGSVPGLLAFYMLSLTFPSV